MNLKNKQGVIIPNNKTKIVCTIGPTSKTVSILKKLIQNGMNIARLNFAHGSLQEHKEDIENIRKASKETGIDVTTLIDLPGTKIRIGSLEKEPICLNKGDKIKITTKDVVGNEKLISVSYKHLTKSVKKGNTIFLSDGLIELKVLKVNSVNIDCEVVVGGLLLSHKGINFPKAKLMVEPVTKKDLEILKYGLNLGISCFSLSFIRDEKDISKIKNYAKKLGAEVKIIAKIERFESVKNIDRILKLADGIMIARGDLGMEIPIEEVPLVQKDIIKKANVAGVPVITATQMMKSMTENSRPTRAEVTDVANAILDGTDAIMLSEETAIGAYPVETVKTMAKIAKHTEYKRNGVPCNYKEYVEKISNHKELSVADVISINVIEAAKILNPKYILSTTETGTTARMISRFKPECCILSFSRNKKTIEFLRFSYGVVPIFLDNKKDSWHEPVLNYIKSKKIVKKGDRVLLTQRRFSKPIEGTDSFGVITI